MAGLPVCALKSSGGKFAGLGLKTGGASGAARWRLRRARGVIVKFRWSSKNLDGFTPEGYLSCIFNEGHFNHWLGRLYIESGLVEETHL